MNKKMKTGICFGVGLIGGSIGIAIIANVVDLWRALGYLPINNVVLLTLAIGFLIYSLSFILLYASYKIQLSLYGYGGENKPL